MLRKFLCVVVILALVGCGQNTPSGPPPLTSSESGNGKERQVGAAKVASLPGPVCMPWNQMTQAEREWQVVQVAILDQGKIGGQCKVWVQDVVWRASGRQVWLPANAGSGSTYGITWESSPKVVGQSGGISGARVGQIVQMRIRTNLGVTPHTAIITRIGSSDMEWIDSNWVGPNKVGTHTMKLKDFNKNVISYSLMTIIG